MFIFICFRIMQEDLLRTVFTHYDNGNILIKTWVSSSAGVPHSVVCDVWLIFKWLDFTPLWKFPQGLGYLSHVCIL